MAIIIPANTLAAGGYSIDNSCRFNRADSAKFERVIDADGSLTTWTFNVWLKRGTTTPSNHYSLLWNRDSSGTAAITSCEFYGAGAGLQTIYFYNYDNPGDGEKRLQTTARYRDSSAWYNLHLMWDSSNGTAGNRMRIFMNGVEETDFILDQNPGSSAEGGLLRGSVATKLSMGFHPYNKSNYYDGYMANAIICDGQAYLPTKFGEFNEDSPTIWQPIDPAEQSLSFGTHGVWLDFADSSALGNDVSGENNDFTPANFAAVDQSTDTPTNNFATFNPLNVPTSATPTFSQGNCVTVSQVGAGLNFGGTSTLGMTAGKWYWECSPTSVSNGSIIGVTGRPSEDARLNDLPGHDSDSYGYVHNGNKITGNSESSFDNTYTDGDIISVALDITNLKIYFAKNGTWQDSGDPTSGATGTGAAFTITAPASTLEGVYAFGAGDYGNGGTTFQANFGGCPAFTVSSAVADGNGYGAFEYAPPSGSLALCTKNLGSDGG